MLAIMPENTRRDRFQIGPAAALLGWSILIRRCEDEGAPNRSRKRARSGCADLRISPTNNGDMRHP